MSWQFFAAINIIGYSVTLVLKRFILKESESRPITYTIFFQLFSGIVGALIGIFTNSITIPQITLTLAFFLFLATCFYAFGNLFIFKSLKETEASKFTIIFSTRVVFTIVLASIFLKESFSIMEIFGTILLFIGIILVNNTSKKFTFNKGDLFALIAAIFFGMANANARFILKDFPLFPYMFFVFFTPALLLSFIYPKEIKYGKMFFTKSGFLRISTLGVVYALANLAFFQAIKIGPSASLVTAVVMTSVVVTVILSMIFLKETDNLWKKIVGTIISFVGLVILTV